MNLSRGSRILFTRILDAGRLIPPKYKHDAGYDLVVSFPTSLPRSSPRPVDVPCGIQVAPPDDIAFIVVARSSAVKRGIIVVPTLIDPGYRGNLYVFAYNMGADDIELSIGDRIAQLLPVMSLGPMFRIIETDELPPSDRGAKGFGSTGGDGYAR